MYSDEEESDWEITAEGLYIARRAFLMRRGYCCANQCRNCPYINWRSDEAWRPIPAEMVKRMRVSTKAIHTAINFLSYHERQLQYSPQKEQEQAYHQLMVTHYHFLLKQWGALNK